jgi:hypothetical protein
MLHHGVLHCNVLATCQCINSDREMTVLNHTFHTCSNSSTCSHNAKSTIALLQSYQTQQ